MAPTVEAKTMDRIAANGLSPRQREINRRWSFFAATQYDARKADWDGAERLDPVERETISSSGFIPPGFYDAGQSQPVPVKFRRPAIPYHLGRAIVNRFTSLLFAEQMHPKIICLGDPDTTDWIQGLEEATRLWARFALARDYGGATGTAVVTFHFRAGEPVVEAHDPRWVFPKWRDRASFDLRELEIRYPYPESVRDPETGLWEDVWFWYRRVIDEERDVRFEPALVGEGDEPKWVVDEQVAHGFGFFPGVWVQNVPVQDDLDGESDLQGVWDQLEGMDLLLSEAFAGVLKNSDPTLVIKTAAELMALKKGSDNAIKLPDPADSAAYLELAGTGPKAARELVAEMREMVLEVCSCVLEDAGESGSGIKTATEVNRRFSSMTARAGRLREQFGQMGVLPLARKIVKASRRLVAPRAVEGRIVRQTISLPPRVDPDTGEVSQRKLGPSDALTIHWPRFFEPSLDDATKAVTAANQAKVGGLVDGETATRFVSPFLGVENAREVYEKAKKEGADQMAQAQSDLLGASGGAGGGGGFGT